MWRDKWNDEGWVESQAGTAGRAGVGVCQDPDKIVVMEETKKRERSRQHTNIIL